MPPLRPPRLRRRLRRPSPALLVAVVALAVALGQADAYATVTTFFLGKSQTSNAPTTLSAASSFPTSGDQHLLQLTNTRTTTGATALGLTVASGHQPFTVSTGAAKVTNLNADKLDGLDSAQLQRSLTGSCAAGSAIRQISQAGAVTCASIPTGLAAFAAAHGGFFTSSSVDHFTTASGGRFLFSFSGSAFSSAAGVRIGLELDICPDVFCTSSNSTALMTADIYANEANSHKALVSGYTFASLDPGTYYLNIVPINSNTLTDNNDTASWSVIGPV